MEDFLQPRLDSIYYFKISSLTCKNEKPSQNYYNTQDSDQKHL